MYPRCPLPPPRAKRALYIVNVSVIQRVYRGLKGRRAFHRVAVRLQHASVFIQSGFLRHRRTKMAVRDFEERKKRSDLVG